MENNDIPGWAIELIKQVERLNEKLPTHIDWVERNILDHEKRIREIERRIWVAAGSVGIIAAVLSFVANRLV